MQETDLSRSARKLTAPRGAEILQGGILHGYLRSDQTTSWITSRFEDAALRLMARLNRPAIQRFSSEVAQTGDNDDLEAFIERFIRAALASEDTDVKEVVEIASKVDVQIGLPEGFSLGIASVQLYHEPR